MGNLFGSLVSTAGSLRVYERALATVQNNVVNANTPGYAKQRQGLEANRFEPDRNVVGGVSAGALYNYRDAYSERSVQSRSSQQSVEQQRANSLTTIESAFPVSAGSGIPDALNKFFNAFSQLTVAPNDAASRQVALDRASDVASTFRRTSNLLLEEKGTTQTTLRSSVDQINALGSRIREINANLRSSLQAGAEPGTEAKLYSALEELSQLVDFDAIRSPDGGVSVYVGGQTLLVIGDRQYNLSTDVSNGQARVLDSTGLEIGGELGGGKVAGLLDIYNNKLPSYLADLDTLAGSFADRVNQTLAQGVDQDGNAPLQDLFSYNGALGASYTIEVNGISTNQLALAASGEPGGNSNAVAVSQLAQGRFVNNQTFQQFYGTVAGRVGRDLSNARSVESVQDDLLSQAKELRQGNQGVSLDEEAALLIQYQRSYQAASQLFKTINDLTESILSVFR